MYTTRYQNVERYVHVCLYVAIWVTDHRRGHPCAFHVWTRLSQACLSVICHHSLAAIQAIYRHFLHSSGCFLAKDKKRFCLTWTEVCIVTRQNCVVFCDVQSSYDISQSHLLCSPTQSSCRYI